MELILSTDALNRLERRFGSKVRQIGTWYSDGIFAYTSIPMSAVKKTADTFSGPAALDTASQSTSDGAELLSGMLDLCGPEFLDTLIITCRDFSAELPSTDESEKNEWVTEWQL